VTSGGGAKGLKYKNKRRRRYKSLAELLAQIVWRRGRCI